MRKEKTVFTKKEIAILKKCKKKITDENLVERLSDDEIENRLSAFSFILPLNLTKQERIFTMLCFEEDPRWEDIKIKHTGEPSKKTIDFQSPRKEIDLRKWLMKNEPNKFLSFAFSVVFTLVIMVSVILFIFFLIGG